MAEREDLLAIRNDILQQNVGKSLLAFLQDKVTDYATKNLDAIEIKGMCRLIQQVKNIPDIVEQQR